MCKKAPFLVFGSEKPKVIDVMEKIKMGGLQNVHIVVSSENSYKWPTLNQYAGALVFTDNQSVKDINKLGEDIANYVDKGGGIVVCPFANCNNVHNGHISGRFSEKNYNPILPAFQGNAQRTNARLVLQQDHFVLNCVNKFYRGNCGYFCSGKVNPNAELIAKWSDNIPLVASLHYCNKGGRIITLNFFPPSSSVHPEWWEASTDGGILMANALIFTSHIHKINEKK